jgi:nitronate monooxygenase
MTAGFLPSRLPIIQAPMAGSQGVELCAAVCEAGGLGSLPTAMLTPSELRDQIAEIRRRTREPFNINFFCHVPPRPDSERQGAWIAELAGEYAEAALDPSAAASGPGRAPFDLAMVEIIEEAKPPIVSFHFGLPDESLLVRVKRADAKIYSSATTVTEAQWLERRGVDAVIAQGAEAGGHRAMFLSRDINGQPGLFALLPQVVDAVHVPVIAAGGIADGRGIAAAFALGAAAVQIGTAYLSTPQSTISAIHRAALRAAKDDSTRLTNLFTGRPARGILNRFMREHGPMNELAPEFPLATGVIAPLRAYHEKRGSGDYSPLWAGQAAALAREEDAGQMTVRLWSEAKAALAAVRLTP